MPVKKVDGIHDPALGLQWFVFFAGTNDDIDRDVQTDRGLGRLKKSRL